MSNEIEGLSRTSTVPSEAELLERAALGLPLELGSTGGFITSSEGQASTGLMKAAVCAPDLLNEAPDYLYPSSFSRGLRVETGRGATHVFLSGTASVGRDGETLYEGDFRAQLWRTYRNLTGLLEKAGATWRDVVRCTCYLRDIERDYADFNSIRTEFFEALALNPLPASTAIQARLCRSDLLVEIEAHAILGGGSAGA